MARIGWPTFWSKKEAAPAPFIPATLARSDRPPEIAVHVRGAPEALDALDVAALLHGSLTPSKARRLVERLGHYRAKLFLRVDADPLASVVVSDQRRLTEATLRYVSPVLVDIVLPGTRDYVLDRLVEGRPPDPAGVGFLPSVSDAADAMRRLVFILNGAGRSHLAAVAAACEEEARRRTERLVHSSAPVSREAVDELARNLMRVEVLTLTLESLGQSSGLEQTRFQSLRLARHALRRASEALEFFVEDRGLVALHTSLSVLAAVDGLIVIVLRILDAQQEHQEEPTPFVEQTDRAAMGRYLTAAGKLADTLLDMAGRAAVTPSIDDLFFEALVHQIAWLHRFCLYCGHDERPPGMDLIQQRLVGRTAKLAGFAGDALVAATMRPDSHPAKLDTLLNRAEAVAELLLDMDRPKELEALGVRILAVRDTLKTVSSAA